MFESYYLIFFFSSKVREIISTVIVNTTSLVYQSLISSLFVKIMRFLNIRHFSWFWHL